MSNSLLHEALKYHEMGLSIIPIKPKDKRPLVKWEPYQQERAEADQIRQWWQKWPKANIGIVTGNLSGIDVIDIDSGKGFSEVTKLLPKEFSTVEATTPRGGRHLYVKHKEGQGNATGFIKDVDYRGQGGYIVAPPSVGENGKPYAWVTDKALGAAQTAPLPLPIYNSLNNSIYIEGHDHPTSQESHAESRKVTSSHINFNQGYRDNTLFHIANCLVKGGMPSGEVQQLLSLMASKACDPPYPSRDISAKIQSALKRAQSKKRNIATDLREWVLVTQGHFKVTEYHAESCVLIPLKRVMPFARQFKRS